MKLDNFKSWILIIATVFLVCSTATALNIGASAARDLPDFATAGETIEVTISVDVNESDLPNAVIITENVPAGWEISSATPNYFSHPSAYQYKWLFFGESVVDTTITYTITVPDNATVENVSFSGTVGTTPGNNDITRETVLPILGEAVNVEVTRSLPDAAMVGSSFNVTLVMDVNETNLPNSVIITENVPAGWEITSSTPSYGYNQSGQYKWLFYTGISDTTITYTITVPGTAPAGNVTFSGTVETSAAGGDITGDSVIALTEVPGDTDGDGDVDDTELLVYIADWSQGGVDDADLLAAIESWAT